jgi:hypothetical protein
MTWQEDEIRCRYTVLREMREEAYEKYYLYALIQTAMLHSKQLGTIQSTCTEIVTTMAGLDAKNFPSFRSPLPTEIEEPLAAMETQYLKAQEELKREEEQMKVLRGTHLSPERSQYRDAILTELKTLSRIWVARETETSSNLELTKIVVRIVGNTRINLLLYRSQCTSLCSKSRGFCIHPLQATKTSNCQYSLRQ